MNTLRIALPVALVAVCIMVSAGYALPSCCQSGNSNNPNAVNSAFPFQGSELRAPVTRIRIQSYRPVPRQAAAPAQPVRQANSPGAGAYPRFARTAQPSASALPSCCAAGNGGYQVRATRGYPQYGQVRPVATMGAISGGCCGGGYRQARVPSCCSAGGGASAGYARPTAPSSGVPSCCATSSGKTAGYQKAPRGTVRAVPASAVQATRTSYYWGTQAGAGAFGKPGYFPQAKQPW